MHHLLAPRLALPKGQHYRSTNPRRPWSQVNAESTPPTLSTQNMPRTRLPCVHNPSIVKPRRQPAVLWPLTTLRGGTAGCPRPPPIGNDFRKQYAILICWAVFKPLSLDCSFLFDIVFHLERLIENLNLRTFKHLWFRRRPKLAKPCQSWPLSAVVPQDVQEPHKALKDAGNIDISPGVWRSAYGCVNISRHVFLKFCGKLARFTKQARPNKSTISIGMMFLRHVFSAWGRTALPSCRFFFSAITIRTKV